MNPWEQKKEMSQNSVVYETILSEEVKNMEDDFDNVECQYHNNCGGWCSTAEEREMNLCADCLEAEREEDREREINHERIVALQRIAIAAGIELATPGEVADNVCAKLKTPNA